MLRYSDKVFHLRELIKGIGDGRQCPQIAMEWIFAAGLVMGLGQLGSLNALEQTRKSIYGQRWVGGKIGSADTIGRGFSKVDCDSIRSIIRCVYSQLKRNKALKPLWAGMIALILDGHESHCSQKQRCAGCLVRHLQTKHGEQIEYYHRHVMASLIFKGLSFPLDIEPQRPGEDEVACAMRLLERILRDYQRAFDLVIADGLYARASFFKFVLKHGKGNGKRILQSLAECCPVRPRTLTTEEIQESFKQSTLLQTSHLDRQGVHLSPTYEHSEQIA